MGNSGSGKSVTAKSLAAALNVPLMHMDKRFWKPDFKKMSGDEMRNSAAEFASQPHWIIEGKWPQAFDTVLDSADTVVFLDISRPKCVFNVLARRLPLLPSERAQRTSRLSLAWPFRVAAANDTDPVYPSGVSFRFLSVVFNTSVGYGVVKRDFEQKLVQRPQLNVLRFSDFNSVDRFISVQGSNAPDLTLSHA